MSRRSPGLHRQGGGGEGEDSSPFGISTPGIQPVVCHTDFKDLHSYGKMKLTSLKDKWRNWKD
jgi:hypothetical protein